tara:strand:- start:769 stop:1068 length:300 start_codon:yes stop_codon:yes gene_type:complete
MFLTDMEKDRQELSIETHIYKFLYILIVGLILFMILTINFIALSTALNINKDAPQMKKLAIATGAFFFGLMYMVFVVYYHRITVLKKPIEFDKTTLFPF